MNINDETLSAFLDSELPEQDMESVRQALADDETLSNRLAALADVDRCVAAHYSRIDEQPMPAAVMAMLTEQQDPLLHQSNVTQGNVVQLSAWRRVHRAVQTQLRQHAAIAAAFALVLGFSAAQFFPANGNSDWHAVAQGLDHAVSGTVATLSNGQQLKPRLTFVNQQGQYCRQFQLSGSEDASENIACRVTVDSDSNSLWYLAASIQLSVLQDPNTYQTASGGSLLDSALDHMITGEVFDSAQEQQLIRQQWTTN